ncbi:MAG: hypothetical protein A2W22_06075 [Candidatus Levybacteria bacterium RBG_16_35_11]|nr:MAG: hypothetical protein A2W22_06075 [Candidatus Levybacteria bacterium RBG_16_35_11]
MVKVKEYFDIKYGVNLEFSNIEKDPRGIPFVARTEKNNGVVGRVKLIEGINPNPANTISVAGGGSVMSSFLQKEFYYSGRDLYYLTPRIELNEKEILFYCMCLKANAFRYSYGRQANKTLGEINIPAIQQIPKWVNMVLYPEYPKEKPVIKEQMELKTKKWHWFYIKDLFNIEKGERIVKLNRNKGKIPLITATSENNGVVDFLSYDDFKETKKCFKDKITIDMFFNVFYHDYNFFCDDNVHILISKFERNNKYISLFLTIILKKLQNKYSYGRQLRLSRIVSDKIKLPVGKDGEPDWQFMENYIKSLAYSSNL